MDVKIYKPICNVGYHAGECPECWDYDYPSFYGFETEEECDKWIENNINRFGENDNGVYPQDFIVEDPTIINAQDEVLKVYQED